MRAFVLDEAAVRKVDRSGAAEHLKPPSDQVARGLQLGSALGPLAAHRRVVVVGMGGSGIAGAVLAAWLAAGHRAPVGGGWDSPPPPSGCGRRWPAGAGLWASPRAGRSATCAAGGAFRLSPCPRDSCRGPPSG